MKEKISYIAEATEDMLVNLNLAIRAKTHAKIPDDKVKSVLKSGKFAFPYKSADGKAQSISCKCNVLKKTVIYEKITKENFEN